MRPGTFLFFGAYASLALSLLACGQDRAPVAYASIRPLTAAEQADPNRFSIADVAAVASGRKRMSCIELIMGDLYAFGMETVATAPSIEADASTRAISGAVGPSSKRLIEEEMKCHCDGTVPMPGYELFERRQDLLRGGGTTPLSPDLLSYYPKDANGQPRFLHYGENIPDAMLRKLPPVPPGHRSGQCDGSQSCLEARARINAQARAEGKPEPYPNLETPPKALCKRAA
ncbi:hypothetical protein GCM10007874_26360 [Labrys miyagiensis]|uniref:Lipoprotein n=1 Tax=Labrys miyagiensis TaxID=346912 RepID=A0ABQ6CLN1_9HYPH|nr:hypothetical protein [Labrys miyagiensis]GLS19619.1 hypothetical protein GCM10007874_26360 [Labrys miyagiensis]